MTTLIVATHNRDKIKEMHHLITARALPVRLLSLDDVPDMPDVIEDAPTLHGNALKKANEIFSFASTRFANALVMSDDTGLEVDALNGAPGVYSARYAQDEAKSGTAKPTYDENVTKLLREMTGKKQRSARFRTVVALVGNRNGTIMQETFEGTVDGEILSERRGTHGFGYDPIFFVPLLQKTLAELSIDEKNSISHRAKAVMRCLDLLEIILSAKRTK
jgi:XTP/dITP diphosphohydrolase